MAVVSVTGPSPYDIHIGNNNLDAVAGHLADSGARRVLVVHQEPLRAVAEDLEHMLEQAGLAPVLACVPDAEAGKDLPVLSHLWDVLGEHGFSRQDAVVGLGGGAVTDLAGFAAATWMRGIKVVHVPTTLLAMVDAAVGGKTGINTTAGKNLVGAFHEPNAVFIDLARIATLPEQEVVSGSAELVKTGFIADPRILELYQEGPKHHWAELVERSVSVKAKVVGEDLKEAGLREILNYGHTLGHAIERREHYMWRHGNAVGVGMMFVAHLAHARGLIDDDLVALHETVISGAGLPTRYEAGAFEELHEAMLLDKKNRDGKIRFVVLDGLGSCTRLEDATVEEMRAAYAKISE